MECLKNRSASEKFRSMNLKRSLFTLALVNLLAAAILSAAVFIGCTRIGEALSPSEIQMIVGADGITKTEAAGQSDISAARELLSLLQIALPILFFVAALILTASLFYELKLKKPLAILTDAANRMMSNDLDFTIASSSEDELGKLCYAFETMRGSLLESSRELWRQTEERKRLNAAFAHDLRNPLTVLKGSAKLARECAGDPKRLFENLDRIEVYTDRVERYVETMSTVQRLEQIEPVRAAVKLSELSGELHKSLAFAADESMKRLVFRCPDEDVMICLDRGILFQIAENLVSNALRFADSVVVVTLSVDSERLTLEVSDDGGGFPADLLMDGIKPFRRGEDAGHFGMGLYICSLLCEKHGGGLKLRNEPGAVAVASVRIAS